MQNTLVTEEHLIATARHLVEYMNENKLCIIRTRNSFFDKPSIGLVELDEYNIDLRYVSQVNKHESEVAPYQAMILSTEEILVNEEALNQLFSWAIRHSLFANDE